jgi:hypothetical protein
MSALMDELDSVGLLIFRDLDLSFRMVFTDPFADPIALNHSFLAGT